MLRVLSLNILRSEILASIGNAFYLPETAFHHRCPKVVISIGRKLPLVDQGRVAMGLGRRSNLSARHIVRVDCSTLLAAMVFGDFRLLGVGRISGFSKCLGDGSSLPSVG